MKFSAGVCLFALMSLGAPVLAEDVQAKQHNRWVQDYTGRQADPSVRFGTLPNGLRYAVLRNTTPSDGVAMRMRFGSGSIAERDDEQGLAHYLEHMAFRGSKNIADGEVVHMLERQGLSFGADTNASTQHDQTVYIFNFPKADATAVDTGFKLFREIGERLTLAPAAIDAERGVILSEERQNDTPIFRSLKANFGNVLAGTAAVKHWPRELVETDKAATPEHLRRFYRANYRPDNATIIVVGNIDPAAIEAEIKARFSDWQAAGKPNSIAIGTPAPASPGAEFIGNGVQDQLTLSWVRPADKRAETLAVDREELLRRIGLTVLNNRLSDRALQAGSPFVGAQAGSTSALMGTASLTQIAIGASPEKWREALHAVTQEQRRLLKDGISPDELRKAVTMIGTQFQARAAGSGTRKSEEIADALVMATNNDTLFTSNAQDLAFAAPILASVTPGDVSAALASAFSGQGPVLFRSAQSAPVTDAALARAVIEEYAMPVAAGRAETAVVWPYTNFGAPSAIVSRSRDSQLGATIVGFANGARLIVKQTPFEKQKIHVVVSLGNGRKGVTAELAHALWAAELFPLGGTSQLSVSQIQQWAQTGGKVVWVKLEAATGAFNLIGGTRPADLQAQMELLTAYVRDPGFRSEEGEKVKAIAPMLAGQLQANAGAVFTRALQAATAGNDARFVGLPTAEQTAATSPDDIPALLRAALAGPADVTIVGDIADDEAIRVVQATFGAGPTRARQPAPKVRITIPRDANTPIMLAHNGRADQAFYGEFWALPDYFADPKAADTADIVAAIIKSRLTDLVREKMGITYTPMVSAVSSSELPGQGYIGAVIETPKANFDVFHDVLAKQMANLVAKTVSADELARAKQPLLAARHNELENNDFWAGNLPLVLRDPRIKTLIQTREQGIDAISANDVQRFAQRYIAGTAAFKIVTEGK